jgi:SAM-dependent methyltransferase
MELDNEFWGGLYATGDTRWDLGAPSTPLKTYIDQLTDKELRTLIPGGGRAYEAEYLHRQGFRNVFALDLSDAPLKDLLARCPGFPKEHLVVGDFFAHKGQYDRIIEQTFFCALDPALRPRYVAKMHELLAPGGKLVGVLFDDPLNTDHPPFGGGPEEYRALFGQAFTDLSFTPGYNSMAPRAGREVWLRAVKSK